MAAPLATRRIADLGVCVIKIERPGGGDFARDYDETVWGMSSHVVWLNRSKKSHTVDLTAPGSIDTVLRLLERADVFVQNSATGAADRGTTMPSLFEFADGRPPCIGSRPSSTGGCWPIHCCSRCSARASPSMWII